MEPGWTWIEVGCPSNKHVVGGGYSLPGIQAYVFAAAPSVSGNSFAVTVKSTGSTGDVYVYASCVD